MPTKTKAPVKKAVAVSLCRSSRLVSQAGRILNPHTRTNQAIKATAGRVLGKNGKVEHAECEKKKPTGLAGAPKKAAGPLSPGQKANKKRVTMISKAAGDIYDTPGYRGTWIAATKKASKQLKQAGKL